MKRFLLILIAAALTGLGFESWAQDNFTDRVNNSSSMENTIKESIKIFGDFRYRHEFTDVEQDGKADLRRQRGRIRARIGLEGRVSEQVVTKLRLSTSEGGDALSGNQSLGDLGSKKDIYFDMAYVDWKLNPATQVWLGKSKNPFAAPLKSQLVFDSDWTPEGAAVLYAVELGEWTLSTHAGAIWIAERAASSTETDNEDSGLLGAQLELSHSNDDQKAFAGLGGYSFTNLQGKDRLANKGNSVDGSNQYLHSYDLLSGYLAYKTSLGGWPVSLLVHYVINTRVSKDNEAYLAGIGIGEVKKQGDWKLSYDYRQVERDAVLGGLQDSDFSGGQTDTKGHVLAASYGLSEGSNVSLAYFDSELGLKDSRDYQRIHADVNFKF